MRPFAALAVAALLALAGCAQSQSCTAIGCIDQLAVSFPSANAFPYQATLTVDGKPASFRCDLMGVHDAVGVLVEICDNRSFVIGGAPASITVSVTCGQGPDDGGAVTCTGAFTPTYTVAQPNGAACPPTCRQASVKLQ